MTKAGDLYTDGYSSTDQGLHGKAKSKGSRKVSGRDPSELINHWGMTPQYRLLEPPLSGEKWCYVCGDTRPKHYFSPHKGTYDGLDPRCKMCEAERKRLARAQNVPK